MTTMLSRSLSCPASDEAVLGERLISVPESGQITGRQIRLCTTLLGLRDEQWHRESSREEQRFAIGAQIQVHLGFRLCWCVALYSQYDA
jgi:hypothetical protein